MCQTKGRYLLMWAADELFLKAFTLMMKWKSYVIPESFVHTQQAVTFDSEFLTDMVHVAVCVTGY